MATRHSIMDAFLAKLNKATLTLGQLQQLAHTTSRIQCTLVKVD